MGILNHLKYPIIQAPMAGVSTLKMAETVSKFGCMGSIAMGAYKLNDTDRFDKTFREYKGVRKLTNLNFFCHSVPVYNSELNSQWIDHFKPYCQSLSGLTLLYDSFTQVSDSLVDKIVDFGPGMVSFHFGLPCITTITKLQSHGIAVFVSVTNLVELQLAKMAQVDGIVLQGYEAGGHRGTFDPKSPDPEWSTLELTNRVLHSLRSSAWKPMLVSAGGIMTPQDIRKYIDLGVDAVQLGTAFLKCEESLTTAAYKNALDTQTQTIMTSNISGRPLRCLATPFVQKIARIRGPIPDYPYPYDSYKKLALESPEYGSYLAGSQFRQAQALDCASLLEHLAKY